MQGYTRPKIGTARELGPTKISSGQDDKLIKIKTAAPQTDTDLFRNASSLRNYRHALLKTKPWQRDAFAWLTLVRIV
jgi:hypothetical protein